MVMPKKSKDAEVNRDIRKRIMQELRMYRDVNRLTNKEMADIAGVHVRTWEYWLYNLKDLPAQRFESLVCRFGLVRSRIFNKEIKQEVLASKYVGLFHKEYAAYYKHGRTVEALQVMRRTASMLFDILHGSGHLVDCVYTTRLKGCEDRVTVNVHIKDTMFAVEFIPRELMYYKFLRKRGAEMKLMHEGVFSNTLLGNITDLMDKELRKTRKRGKAELMDSTSVFVEEAKKLTREPDAQIYEYSKPAA